MVLVPVDGYRYGRGWENSQEANRSARACCEQLEDGNILFFPGIPFDFPESDRVKLLQNKQSGMSYHKNISFRPATQELRGLSADSASEKSELTDIMANYSDQVVRFVERLLLPYASHFTLDYASYRAIEESSRHLSLHKRNDLLHVDAFPSRPTGGNRILRVFTNINPQRDRCWMVGEGFDKLAERFAHEAGLERIMNAHGSLPKKVLRSGHTFLRLFTGAQPRTGYDSFMLHFHDWLKENSAYQRSGPKTPIDFPPGSTWLVYTDYVPHAVMSGQFALEQTFIIDFERQVCPYKAPIRILEQLRQQKRMAA